jgi:hypothetical protein
MAFIVFVGVYAIGDPIELLVNPQADAAGRARATAALGLDKPFAEQFVSFLAGVCAATSVAPSSSTFPRSAHLRPTSGALERRRGDADRGHSSESRSGSSRA